MSQTAERIVVIGCSANCADALAEFLTALPFNAPGIVIAQCASQTAELAAWLNDQCSITVKEASDGDAVMPGRALIAPSGSHMLVKRLGARCFVDVRPGAFNASVEHCSDVLFRSAARWVGIRAIGIILSSTNSAGSTGLLEMNQAGACTMIV